MNKESNAMNHHRKAFTHYAAVGIMCIAFWGSVFSAKGDITNAVHTVIKAAFMGKAASNELARISQDGAIDAKVRQFAENAIQNHDRAGTNSYNEISAFLTNWTITNEPPMTTNTIVIMKKSLELGVSALGQLQHYVSDTNTPPHLKDVAGRMLTNIVYSTKN